MDTTTLLDGTSVLEDPDLHEQQAKAGSLAVSGWFKWITFEVLGHAVLATLCTGTSFVVMEYILDVSPNVSLLPHACTGITIGLLLVARVVVGSQQATAAAGQVISFASGLRTVAMLSCNVSEKLTISAGADLEKKATAKFRYELVRLLNLAFYSYTLMLKGFKLVTPPASLVPLEGGIMEVSAARGRRGLPRLHVQAAPPPTACPTPTLLTCCAGCLLGRGTLRGLVPHRDGLQVDYQPVRAATPSTAHHRYPGCVASPPSRPCRCLRSRSPPHKGIAMIL